MHVHRLCTNSVLTRKVCWSWGTNTSAEPAQQKSYGNNFQKSNKQTKKTTTKIWKNDRNDPFWEREAPTDLDGKLQATSCLFKFHMQLKNPRISRCVSVWESSMCVRWQSLGECVWEKVPLPFVWEKAGSTIYCITTSTTKKKKIEKEIFENRDCQGRLSTPSIAVDASRGSSSRHI